MTPSHFLSIQLSLLLHRPSHTKPISSFWLFLMLCPTIPNLKVYLLPPASLNPAYYSTPSSGPLTGCWSHPDSPFFPCIGWSLPTHCVINKSLDKVDQMLTLVCAQSQSVNQIIHLASIYWALTLCSALWRTFHFRKSMGIYGELDLFLSLRD